MIKLTLDNHKKVVYTNWILKLNKIRKERTVKSGKKKVYSTYSTSFPQELYEFFDIKNNSLYLVKDNIVESITILTDKKPKLPVSYFPIKLINRRKEVQYENRIPTTSFILPKKMFNNLDEYNKVVFTLHPTSKDPYRNKEGLITLDIIK